MANETNSTVYYGIYHRLGSGTPRHNIDSGLERNKEYAARVEATINSYKITSHNIQFSKFTIANTELNYCFKSFVSVSRFM